MSPRSFAVLAVAAAVSAAAAIAVYTSSVEWSRAVQGGMPLFADLRDKAPHVATIEVVQGDKRLTLQRDGDNWVLREHESFPAAPERVTGLLGSLTAAELAEAKTKMEDRYALLGVEDPSVKEAKSRLVRLLDGGGKELAAVIVGEKRLDPSGLGQSGTYVRRPGEEQAWLATANIDAGLELKDWVDPRLFEARRDEVKTVEVVLPGEEPLKIKRDPERPGHTLEDIPDGMKLKYINVVDEVVRAASTLEFTDVRKDRAAPDDAATSTVVMELDDGLKVTAKIWDDGGETWLTLQASGDGEAGKRAEALTARAKGWQFRITESRAKEILKRRGDLLEKVSS